MEKLDNLIEKLNTDRFSGVTVVDLDTSEFVSDYITAESFFEDLFAKGYKRLNLIPPRKKGSVYKMVGPSL